MRNFLLWDSELRIEHMRSKMSMGIELLDAAASLDPGLTLFQGLIYIEMLDNWITMAKDDLKAKRITLVNYKEKLRVAGLYLSKSTKHLREENDVYDLNRRAQNLRSDVILCDAQLAELANHEAGY